MSFVNGTIGEIIKALDMSGVEMLAISLPEARIVDATQCLARRLGCSKYDMVGRQLSQSAEGTFQAHYIDADLTGLGTHTAARIELTYKPETGQPLQLRFKPQLFRDGAHEFLLLIGQPAHLAGAQRAKEAETRLELAVKAGGYMAWDYDFRTRGGATAPEIADMLGLHAGEMAPSFLSLDGRAHPDDAGETASARLRGLSGPACSFLTRYRLRQENGEYVWVEVMAGLVKDPITGQPAKIVGLTRDISAAWDASLRAVSVERGAVRPWTVARMGSWDLDVASGRMHWSEHMCALLGLDRRAEPSFETLRGLIVSPHQARWEDAIQSAASGQPVIGVECDIRLQSGELRRINSLIDPEFSPDGTVARLHGICHDTTELIVLERKALQAQKMETVGRLTGGIARDFDTLLSAALGNLRLAEASRDSDDSRMRIGIALEALSRGQELATRLLAFSDPDVARAADNAALTAEGAVPAPPDATEAKAPEVEAPARRRPVVLIVEDNDAVRDVAVAMVEELGCEVLEAANGPDALQLLRDRPDIALLLSDTGLTGMMGPELVFQALELRPDLKILSAGGPAGEEIPDLPQVVDHIEKPFTREALGQKVRSAIGDALAA